MAWLYPIIFLITIFVLLYKYCTRNFDHWKNKNIFYLKPTPFLGNFTHFFKKETLGHSVIDLCKSAANRDYFGIFIFDRPVLVVMGPKIIKSILQKDGTIFINRTVTSVSRHPVMSNILFVQRDNTWKEARSKLSPIFTSGKLKMMFPLMLKESEEMTDYISNVANVPDVESKEICARYSTNVIARCAFGVEANSFKNDNALFRKIGRSMFDFRIKTAFRQIGSFFTPKLHEWLNVTFFDPEIIESLQGIFTDVLHTRKASTSRKGNDFIDILLDTHGTSFSENAMLGQAIQMFGAGFETVASTLAFAFYELCINPDIQEKLRAEIKEHIAKNNGVTYEMLTEMKYLDMCFSETLRKYPPVSFLDRTCSEDYKVEGTDLFLEKGTQVYIPVNALHYNPELFPNPEKYDPERFADKSKINSNGLFYLPFGEGPRICIGQRFGIMEAKIALISVLSKFRLEASSKTPIPIVYVLASFIPQSKVGFPVKFVPL